MDLTAPDITFIGNHTHSLDGKNRAVLPKKWRGEGDQTYSFMVRYDKEGYLMFYPPNQVALLRKRINSIKEGKNRHLAEQALFGDSFEVECDSSGRITLPERLVTQAGFKKEGQVTFVAQGEKFSLWDSDRYEAQRAQRAEVDVFELMASLEN